MSRVFYPKLAVTNIRKNKKTYFPYILTCICTIMMFYIMGDLARNAGLDSMSGGRTVQEMLSLGTYVIGIFAVIFLFYTNSFLIRRRKKEIGMYNILGMEKKHIARMLLCETLYTFIVSIVLGILGGILLSKLIFLILLKLLHFSVPFVFGISIPSMIVTVCLFAGISIITLLFNLVQIHLANPIELLNGGKKGEKEPKTKWIMTAIGVLSLGGGYYISLTTESPVKALSLFFVAVILVIIGTHALFSAGSITVLKLMRKNKKFYYKPKNFTSVSGMIYRMKQNAAGLANICILSTCVLVTISTTISLYAGMDNLLRNMFPRDYEVSGMEVTHDDEEKVNRIMEDMIKKSDIQVKDKVSYRYNILHTSKRGNTFIGKQKPNFNVDGQCKVEFLTLADYNKMQNCSATLNNDEILIYTPNAQLDDNTVIFNGVEYKIKEKLNNMVEWGETQYQDMFDCYYVVVNNENTLNTIMGKENSAYALAFNIESPDEEVLRFVDACNKKLAEVESVSAMSLHQNKEDFYAMYGGLFFLGIFLGALFLMATVLIIYYKQISEGFDDRERFEIMQKVGMSKKEIRSTIRRQILMVFFLPLVIAAIHIAFAFPVITKILKMFNLTNIMLFFTFTVITVLVFAVIYTIVYALTARSYYHIISD